MKVTVNFLRHHLVEEKRNVELLKCNQTVFMHVNILSFAMGHQHLFKSKRVFYEMNDPFDEADDKATFIIMFLMRNLKSP